MQFSAPGEVPSLFASAQTLLFGGTAGNSTLLEGFGSPSAGGWSASITNDALVKTALCFLLGNFFWTIIEYGMHRCLFHIDEVLPDHPAFLTVHFLTHGIHHYLPMDQYVSFVWFLCRRVADGALLT